MFRDECNSNEASTRPESQGTGGFDSIPPDMIDTTVIEEARSGGSSNSSFLREYCAQFTDGSDSYFSAKKMYDCTIPDGEKPNTLLKGAKDQQYILAIDPKF